MRIKAKDGELPLANTCQILPSLSPQLTSVLFDGKSEGVGSREREKEKGLGGEKVLGGEKERENVFGRKRLEGWGGTRFPF